MNCPSCGRKTILRHDGIFQWRACPASKSCGWDVFSHERAVADAFTPPDPFSRGKR